MVHLPRILKRPEPSTQPDTSVVQEQSKKVAEQAAKLDKMVADWITNPPLRKAPQ